MSNLSKISTSLEVAYPLSSETVQQPKRSAYKVILVGLSFPLIAGALFAGHHFSAQRKEVYLVASAQKLITENEATLNGLSDYQFSPTYVRQAQRSLSVINKIDKNFPEVMVIFPDTIESKKAFLGFGGRWSNYDEKEEKQPDKLDYIFSTSKDERIYLESVFSTADVNYRFEAKGGNYHLYFPVTLNGKRMLLYFSDFQRYGKFGS